MGATFRIVAVVPAEARRRAPPRPHRRQRSMAVAEGFVGLASAGPEWGKGGLQPSAGDGGAPCAKRTSNPVSARSEGQEDEVGGPPGTRTRDHRIKSPPPHTSKSLIFSKLREGPNRGCGPLLRTSQTPSSTSRTPSYLNATMRNVAPDRQRHKLVYKLMTTDVRYDKEVLIAAHLARLEQERTAAA